MDNRKMQMNHQETSLEFFIEGRTASIGNIINDKGEITNKDEQYDFLEFYVST